MPRDETLGELSSAEQSIADAPKSESQRLMKLRLEDEEYEAEKMVEWYELRAKERTPTWENVQGFAHWTARLALIRDRLERMGWA